MSINIISGGAGYLVPMVIHIFSTPFVIRILGEEAYGLQSLASVVIGYLIVADMGLDIPITRKVAEYYTLKEHENNGSFLTGTIKLYLIIGIIGMSILLLTAEKLLLWFSIPQNIMHEARQIFYLASIGFLGSVLTMWGKAVFNGMQRYDISNAISIFNNIFGIALGLMLLMMGYGVVGFFTARILGFILASIFYILLAQSHMKGFKFFPIVDITIWRYLKTQIGYGIILRMSGLVFSKMDQALISAWVGIAVAGVYAVPLLIVTTLSGLITSLTHFAFPMASAMNVTSSSEEVEHTFKKLSKFIVSLATLIFVPFIVLGENFFSLWIDPDFANKSQYTFTLLLVAFYLNTCLTAALNSFVVGIGHLRFFTVYAVSRSVILLLGFTIFVRAFGMEGAAIAYLVSTLTDIVYFIVSLRKKLNFGVKNLLLSAYVKPMIIGVTLVVTLSFSKEYVNTWPALIAVFIGFGVIFLFTAITSGVVDKAERFILFGAVKKLKSKILNDH